MKKFYLSYLLSYLIAFSLHAQTTFLKGQVKTPDNAPLEYANVVLTAIKDSAFIGGTVTDSLGRFKLDYPLQSGQHVILTISCLGYTTYMNEAASGDRGVIRLQPGTQHLDEVVVEGIGKNYRMKGSTLCAEIQASILKDAGNAMDVLKHIPFVHIAQTKITVFGKGEPLIYINNKKVRTLDELQRLNSTQIKNIEVLTSPGAEYDASVGAVIRITTSHPLEEGLGGSLYGRMEKRQRWNEAVNLNLSYKVSRWELYGDFSALDGRLRQNQDDHTLIRDKINYQTDNTAFLLVNRQQYATAAGADYAFNSHHSAGARYSYAWLGKSGYSVTNRLTHSVETTEPENLENVGLYDPAARDGYLNTYYAGDIKAFHLNGNVDYAHGRSSTAAGYQNHFADGRTETVNSLSKNTYRFIAAKLDVTHPIGKGTGLLGAEYAYTNNESRYKNDNADLQEDLPATQTVNRQNLWAFYLNYQWIYRQFALDAGLRFEQVDFCYKLNQISQKDQSKKLAHLFPVVTLSYAASERSIQTSLSYKRTIRRPSYYQLRGDIQYNSPYAYEAGNPALQSSFVNDLSYSFAYRDLTFLATYQFVKDKIFFITEQFNAQPITLSRFINSHQYKKLNASAVWSPTFFHIWTPELEIGVEKQFLSLNEQNREKTYNHPLYYIRLFNTFRLPLGIQVILSGAYSTASHSDFMFTYTNKWVDFSIQKKCLADKLTLRLGIEDLFQTNVEKWKMEYKNVCYSKWNSGDSQAFYFSVSYNFSTLKTYKGDGAATKERSRLSTL